MKGCDNRYAMIKSRGYAKLPAPFPLHLGAGVLLITIFKSLYFREPGGAQSSISSGHLFTSASGFRTEQT